MNNNLKHFRYSQNSINTYKSCPIKFKYKYIDNINWKYDDFTSEEYYQSLKLGREFHLLCERYFSNIPLGKIENEKFNKWMERIKKIIPVVNEKEYISEYEVRRILNGNEIQAKYDLVVIGKNTIDIWDWKTESKQIIYKNVEARMQTMVYLVLAKEVIPKLLNIDVKTEDIRMNYYQPEFDEEPITITYSDEKHENYKKKINEYIDLIKRTRYEGSDGDINIEKNEKHCSYCEFNKLCNN